MAWVQYLVWMYLVVATQSGGGSTPDSHKYYSEGSRHFQPSHHTSYEQHDFYNFYPDLEWENRQPLERRSDNPVQRVNERSISVASSLQEVQENEKIIEPRIDNRSSRVVNSSYKIVNDFGPRIQNRNENEEGISIRSRENLIFPGLTSATSQYVPQIPEECIKTGFCEDVPNYPEAYVNRIIKQIGDTSDKFKMDELLPPDIAQRTGQPEEIELCTYQEKIVMPRAAPDRDGKWHFIVNRNEKPVQGFRIEICKGDTSCNSDVAHFTYTAKCKQKRMLRHMTALDRNGNAINVPFSIPSCCKCVLTVNEE